MAYAEDLFDLSKSALTSGVQNALPSVQDRETASSRLRSRLMGAQGGLESQIRDQYAGRGFSNSGSLQGALNKSRGQYLGQLGSGLADIEEDFGKRLQEGSRTLLGAGQTAGELGLGSQRQALEETLGLGNLGLGGKRLALDETLGLGKLGLEGAALDQERKAQQAKNVLDAFLAFGAFGNLGSALTGPAQTNFNRLLERMFGVL